MKKLFRILLVLLFIGGSGAGIFYYYVFGPNTSVSRDGFFLYIPTRSSFNQVLDSLEKHHILNNTRSFERVSRKKGYASRVKPGRYLITNNMSNNDLVNLLRSGTQTPINLTFNNIRTAEELAGRLALSIESDSISILKILKDKQVTHSYGFTPNTILLMFIPNTYEVFWNTQPPKLMDRMYQEYRHFWTNVRKQQALKAGMSPIEVGILASIVESETNKNEDKPIIAGVYLNRLSKGMHLEADPTIKYALNDFSIQRVLKKDLTFPSPYNTYLNTGLPPGPIAMPSVASLDAVLNYKHHNFLFFCAKPDLSGYSNFAVTFQDHINNAKAYQKALDKINLKH